MRTVVITGGHKGLGLEATTTIAKGGGVDIILAGRNRDEMNAVALDLSTRFHTSIRTVDLDMSSLASVRTGAASVRKLVQDGTVGPVNALMLNAGAQFMGPVEYSADGYEKTFATNCLGNFLLLNLLLDDLADDGRVVFTASGTHNPETMDGKLVGKAVEPDATKLANDGKGGKPISGGKRYTTSKLCTVMYAYELDRRLRASGSSIQSIAFDPGLIAATGLTRTLPPMMQWISRTAFVAGLMKAIGVTMGSIAFSGDTLARIAVDPAFAIAGGKYLQSHNGVLIEATSSVVSYDAARAGKLWVDSEALTGVEERTARPKTKHMDGHAEYA